MTDHRPSGDATYEIRVRGRLDPRWAGQFEGCTISAQSDGTTVLRAEALDQAALHGLLRRVRDLGVLLLSVTRADAGETDAREGAS